MHDWKLVSYPEYLRFLISLPVTSADVERSFSLSGDMAFLRACIVAKESENKKVGFVHNLKKIWKQECTQNGSTIEPFVCEMCGKLDISKKIRRMIFLLNFVHYVSLVQRNNF